jgi:hypothetical protein
MNLNHHLTDGRAGTDVVVEKVDAHAQNELLGFLCLPFFSTRLQITA